MKKVHTWYCQLCNIHSTYWKVPTHDGTCKPITAVENSAVVPLSVGQEFDCFQDFKAAVYEWAVNSNHPVRLDKSDRSRNLFCCKNLQIVCSKCVQFGKQIRKRFVVLPDS
jgi:hypothetical protein